ncbi:sugar ABC transporter permease [Anopheles sinensis]|uniref:Sugar ABC transporter permease n=1 Tax=Anopheles sinensis TaxID=74873 RepID=A0A084WJZ4_ANOSI|nr:sugar ABC transporter permease [Anopheles sinensis]
MTAVDSRDTIARFRFAGKDMIRLTLTENSLFPQRFTMLRWDAVEVNLRFKADVSDDELELCPWSPPQGNPGATTETG